MKMYVYNYLKKLWEQFTINKSYGETSTQNKSGTQVVQRSDFRIPAMLRCQNLVFNIEDCLSLMAQRPCKTVFPCMLEDLSQGT